MKSVAATIGMFDGVHAGHKYLLSQLVVMAKSRDMIPAVITFSSHPAESIPGKTAPALLSSLDNRLKYLYECGIEKVILLDFNPQLAALTSTQFLQFIHREHDVRMLLVGFNHHFGSDCSSRFVDYVAEGAKVGVEVVQASEYNAGSEVSSSAVRRLLATGDVTKAGELLGRCYSIEGVVVEGYRNGRKLGFPTANVDAYSSGYIPALPANGVYAVWFTLQSGERRAGVCNIGLRPTVSPDGNITVEVHILDFSEDIYGTHVRVDFVQRLRGEQRFSSIDELKAQLKGDCDVAREILK